MSLNKVTLIGRLGQKPTLQHADSGTTYTHISVATDATVKGEKRTTWHRVTAFNKTAEHIVKYLDAGRQVYIEARLDYSTREDEHGTTHYNTNIIAEVVTFLDGKPKSTDNTPEDDESDIPF